MFPAVIWGLSWCCYQETLLGFQCMLIDADGVLAARQASIGEQPHRRLESARSRQRYGRHHHDSFWNESVVAEGVVEADIRRSIDQVR